MVLGQPVLFPSCRFISQAVCLLSRHVRLALIEGTCEEKVVKMKSLINYREGVEDRLSKTLLPFYLKVRLFFMTPANISVQMGL